MLFWIVIAGIAAAEAAIVVSALRMHVESDPSRGILGARPTEVVWTLLPVLLVIALALYSHGARQDGEVSPDRPLASGSAEQQVR